jgi:hypothetical protein
MISVRSSPFTVRGSEFGAQQNHNQSFSSSSSKALFALPFAVRHSPFAFAVHRSPLRGGVTLHSPSKRRQNLNPFRPLSPLCLCGEFPRLEFGVRQAAINRARPRRRARPRKPCSRSRSPFAVRRSRLPFTVRRSPFAVHRSPFAVCRWKFVRRRKHSKPHLLLEATPCGPCAKPGDREL